MNLEMALKGLPQKINPNFATQLKVVLLRWVPLIHAAYDQVVRESLSADQKEVTCKRGCSACCSHYVDSVEPFELLAIHFAIVESEQYPEYVFGSHRRMAYFEKVSQNERKSHPEEEADDRGLHRYFLRGIPCSFLKSTGECGIYENRPMSCRMFFSTSPAKYCKGSAIASPWNKNFQIELPDEAERALATCSHQLAILQLPESLFAGIVAANALMGPFGESSENQLEDSSTIAPVFQENSLPTSP